MANRIGITEAPLATLGAPETIQTLPIAEQVGNQVTPKRTTITDMANFFQSEGNRATQQIQRFRTDNTQNTPFEFPNNLAINQLTNLHKVFFTDAQKEILAGDADFYETVDGNIVPSVTGLYRIHWNFVGEYNLIGNQGNWRWNALVITSVVESLEGIQGRYIRPSTNASNFELGIGTNEIIGTLSQTNPLTISIAYRNIGNSASSSTAVETMLVTNEAETQNSFITIQQI